MGVPIGGSDGAASSVALSANGNSGPFDLVGVNSLLLASAVLAVNAAGTLTVFLDVADFGGNWQQQAALSAQSAAGVVSVTVQPAAAVRSGLTPRGRFRWTVTGGGSFTALLVAVGGD